MIPKKTRRMNFRGYRRSIWTSLTALITLLMPVASGYAQTNPAATASAKHWAKAPAEGGDDQSIRPFSINVSQDVLTDLKRRLAATRWPEQETVADRSQGVQLATMKALVSYWQTHHDWRKVRGQAERPATIRHQDRWAGHPFHSRPFEASERLAGHRHPRMARLDHRAAEDYRSVDRSYGAWWKGGGRVRSGDPFAARLWVFRKADHDRLGSHPHRTRLDCADEAAGIHAVCRAGRRLGECRHRADGAAGASGIDRHAHQYAGDRPGRRCEGAPVRRAAAGRPLSGRESAHGTSSISSTSTASATPRRWRTVRRHCTRLRIHRSAWPHGCSITMLAVCALIARVFNGQTEGLTRDDILDNVTLYWLTNTAVSSARLYWESKLAFFAPKGVPVPIAVSVFPDEIYAAPRSWTEKAYPKLIYYNRLPKGGHFAAWEQPESFVTELRAAFRSLRTAN